MPDLKLDRKKIKQTVDLMISKLLDIKRQPSSATREDTNFLGTRLQLLEYLVTEKAGTQIDAPPPITALSCKICAPNPRPFTAYHYHGEWYCADHYPKGVTWPIGMHGDDLKRYKGSSNAASDNRVPLPGQNPSGAPEEYQLSETLSPGQPPSE